MLTTPEAYAASLDSPGKDWLVDFLGYMAERHGDITPVMFRQRPMYKVGKSYVLFNVAKSHISVHTMNFDLIEGLKGQLPGADFGKGCVKVKFTDEAARPVLRALCDEVVRVNRLPDPPPVDTVPILSYAEQLEVALPGVRAKWIPLYAQLLDMARARLPAFVEFFPAVSIRWKHDTTFAEISGTAAAMRVEFYAASPRPEVQPVKTRQLSANRVAHTVELTDGSRFDDLLVWIAESYALTQKPQKRGQANEQRNAASHQTPPERPRLSARSH